ncbi:glycogen synthase GlgA [Jannaschia sp. W003]|uniref:glycogen synthase GlgA n=1 Tax=Jannaschia sp. W003 TaxID=2867012 RepID=UPI0021A7CD70|nr:glycogen synthase GlgA [Jannaschia sp. W003]UWQ19988.1 glycogen synthase GlgA [Jannaschia sp. W003]
MQVLSVASECAPLVKTGGLADVAGALPGALAPLGIRMRTLVPGYPAVTAAAGEGRATWHGDLFGGPARVLESGAAGLDLLVLDAPHLFAREGSIYLGPDGRDWPDNPERFAALSWTAAAIAGRGLDGWRPDILHGHDWQAGLAPVYLREGHPGAGVGTVLTIHNVAFQGLADADRLGSLRLPASGMTAEGFEYWGRISALKAGLVWSDRITTVSPTYAAELMRPEFGMGLDGLLRARARDLVGILNGVDTEEWAPPYRLPSGKRRHTEALRAEMGLPDAPGPLCVVVSRLTAQKGLDLLLEALPALLEGGGQLALLGSGDPALEHAFREAAERHRDVAVRIGYDEGLARRLVTGGEAILVPSRFEPCGLTQLYGLRFGTIPVVALTGGLADTVIPATLAGLWARAATGIQVHPVTADALARALRQLCALHGDAETWKGMQRRAMCHPVGWERSAGDYAALYKALTG